VNSCPCADVKKLTNVGPRSVVALKEQLVFTKVARGSCHQSAQVAQRQFNELVIVFIVSK